MAPADWNLLLYAIAGNADEHGQLTEAVAQMHRALTTDRCKIAVQVHAPGTTTRYWIAAGHDVRMQVLPNVVDASRQASLTGFLDDANREFPATASALILWAHGSGLDHVHEYPDKPGADAHPAGPGLGGSRRHQALIAHSTMLGYDVLRATGGGLGHEIIAGPAVPGALGLPAARRADRYGCRWGPDPNTKAYLTNVAMKQAIAASGRGHVDVLAMNACWMAALEVEYELRNVAAVEVASQVYARSWPYGAIVAAMAKAPAQTAEQLARDIVGAVRDDIKLGKRDDAVSAVRAGAAMEALATALDPYAKRVTALIDSDWTAVYDAVMMHAQRVDDPYQVDLRSLIRVLGAHDAEAAAAARIVDDRLDALVVAHVADQGHPGLHGLSIFCPKSTHVDLIDAYQGTDFRTHSWAKFLVKFQRRVQSS